VKNFGTVERIEGSVIEQTEVDAADYQAGADAMCRALEEGYRLLNDAAVTGPVARKEHP